MILPTIFTKYKTGLVLSGGAVKGFAHLGVLKALREKKMLPDVISGVSAGAIFCALFADGFESEEFLELFKKKKFFSLVKFKMAEMGFLNMADMEKLLKNNLKATTFEELKIPLFIAATNIKTAQTTYFHEGNLMRALLASSSIPVLFKPVVIDGEFYLDGGITDNLPISPLRGKCRQMIGVHVNPVGMASEIDGIMTLAIRSFHMSITANIPEKSKELKYFIEPVRLRDYSYFDLSKTNEIFELGYQEALRVLIA